MKIKTSENPVNLTIKVIVGKQKIASSTIQKEFARSMKQLELVGNKVVGRDIPKYVGTVRNALEENRVGICIILHNVIDVNRCHVKHITVSFAKTASVTDVPLRKHI